MYLQGDNATVRVALFKFFSNPPVKIECIDYESIYGLLYLIWYIYTDI